MIAVSDPCGPQGRLVVQELLRHLPPASLVALVGGPQEAMALRLRGVLVREVHPERPATVARALAGVERLLLLRPTGIDGAVGRLQALVDGARTAGVRQVVYTSVLHADTSPLPAAAEHRRLEAVLRIAGLPHVLLRQGICVEEYTANIPAALEYQAVLGCARDGRISCASSADYAFAAVAVLLSPITQQRRVFELAGGSAFSLRDLAAEIGRQCGQRIRYVDLPSAVYRAALVDAGVDKAQAQQLMATDMAAGQGALLGSGCDLERLIGRRATTLQQAVAAGVESCWPQLAPLDPRAEAANSARMRVSA